MNEQTNDTQAGEDEPAMGTVNELDVLKQRARMMGVEFSNNIGVETLRDRIRAKAEEQSNATAAPAPALFDPPSFLLQRNRQVFKQTPVAVLLLVSNPSLPSP